MSFSGLPFLYYFLPAALLLYFLAPKRARNPVLLTLSLVFYGWGEPGFLLPLLFSVGQVYLFGLLIQRSEGRHRRLFLLFSVALSLGVLLFYRYADRFMSGLNAVTGLHLPLPELTVPLGLAFLTLRLIGYAADVYRRRIPAERSFIDLAVYVTMFPTLLAGPLASYAELAPRLRERTTTAQDMGIGARRFVLGLGKKVLLANAFWELCALFKTSGDASALFAWLYALTLTLQVYYDFSGWSDMAIGLGRIFGFELPENFHYPFTVGSLGDFCRRWHITLGAWFREYLFVPLGGDRGSAPCRTGRLLLVCACAGLWHGAGGNFLLCGLLFGALLTAEKRLLGKRLARARVLRHVYVLLAVTPGFVLLDSATLRDAGTVCARLFGAGTWTSVVGVYTLKSYAVRLLIAVVGATPLPGTAVRKLAATKAGDRALTVLEPLFLAAVLLLSTAFLVDGSAAPFLYFRL